MEERDNKTIMCSVLFLDIAEYSKKPVSEQISLKDGFNAFLSNAIRNVPINDRIILDTGDGAAISFLGDVGDALTVALSLRESFFKEGVLMTPPLLVRLGINLGPVRLVKDINGQPNIVGDGINVAQRIMGFADPGQILVSRSYYDAVSRLSQEYAGMFHYQGSRTDKHVREHEVYAIGYPGEFTSLQNPVAKNPWQATVRWLDKARSAFQAASSQQRALYIGVPAAALVLLIALLVKVSHRPSTPLPPVAEAPSQPVAAQAVSEVAEAAPKIAEPMAEKKPAAATMAEKKPAAVTMAEEKPKAVRPMQETPRQETPKQVPVRKETSRQIPAGQESARKPISTTRTLEETTAVEPGAAALVSIAVTPWGEIYLDGRMQGVSPPLVELQVAPGKHEIEIRNTTFPAHVENIQVKANEKIKIMHKFR